MGRAGRSLPEQIFPPTLTLERREEIISFKQKEDESIYNAWERYKQLLRRCPMHGIKQMTKKDILYHAMNYTSKVIIDAACCGAFKRKSAEEANQLIEDLVKRNYMSSILSFREQQQIERRCD